MKRFLFAKYEASVFIDLFVFFFIKSEEKYF